MHKQALDQSPWWLGATIYQIYPRSYADSNSDGIGDLEGIINKLDYIASLKVDAIWLSPFFRSPMKDFGYDISDFCDVDPLFGALHDFDRLIKKAHRLGLKVIIDQVYSHTSDQHDWFKQSRADRANPKADWYVWADPKADGSPPNNWQSVFNGPAWTWDGRRRQYYLHNFLDSQPDLNLHNKEVQDAILDAARFWLDLGVDGFRLDVVNFYMHDPELRDNPAVSPTQKDGWPRTFNYQDHLYNQSHPNIVDFLKRLRITTDKYDAIFTLAEIGGEELKEVKGYIEGEHRLHSAYGFDFLYSDVMTPTLLKDALGGWLGKTNEEPIAGAWPSWTFSNHDAPRAVSRWSPAGDSKLTSLDSDKPSISATENLQQWAKLYGLLLASLRGNIILYQGEELGLPQGDVPFEQLQDPEAIANWPSTLGRDGARTPMPWRQNAPQAGFSNAASTWLPIDPRHKALCVDAQEKDSASTLHFFRRVLSFRASSAALKYGSLQFLTAPEGCIAFLRVSPPEKLLCFCNLNAEPAPLGEHAAALKSALIRIGLGDDPTCETIPPGAGFIARVE